jgi:hypothetical protein
MKRRFRLVAGVLPLPKSLLTAPGGMNMRLEKGDTFELEATQIDRFIRRRIEAGDIVEITLPTKKGSDE